jgi:hypothetical protein
MDLTPPFNRPEKPQSFHVQIQAVVRPFYNLIGIAIRPDQDTAVDSLQLG